MLYYLSLFSDLQTFLCSSKVLKGTTGSHAWHTVVGSSAILLKKWCINGILILYPTPNSSESWAILCFSSLCSGRIKKATNYLMTFKNWQEKVQ